MNEESQTVTIILVIDLNRNFSCGDRIKELRLERSLSQERLALNAGITPAYLGLLERGKKNATVIVIERLCDVLNISLSEFFSSEESSVSVDDDISRQILYQLGGLSDAEKQAFLQLVKQGLYIRQLGIQGGPLSE